MNTHRRFALRRRLLHAVLCGFVSIASLQSAEDPVAVFSQVYNGYERTRLPDGTFEPEAYTFGKGGKWTRAEDDPEMERFDFYSVARAVAGPLAGLNYLPAKSSDEAELLILVFWGSTDGSRDFDPAGSTNTFSAAAAAYSAAKFNDEASKSNPDLRDAGTSAASDAYDSALWLSATMNDERDRLDDRNARILGYTEHLSRARFASHFPFAQDIINEVADSRYYVVLQAYDFKIAVAEKKLKPLWTARISMPEHGNSFADSLDRMLVIAKPFLGQDSRGLKRHQYPEARVELGPLKVIEDEPVN